MENSNPESIEATVTDEMFKTMLIRAGQRVMNLAESIEEATYMRNEMILAAHKRGYTDTQIGNRVGLNRVTVWRIRKDQQTEEDNNE